MELQNYIQNMSSMYELGIMCSTVYLTVVTAYLIAAYSVGHNLNISQFAIISLLFVIFAALFALGSHNFFVQALGLTAIVQENPEGTGQYLAKIIFSAEIAGILAALKFMYDIRKENA